MLTVQILSAIGVCLFAVSGGSVAVSKRYDIIGVLALGMATALGGGILRDVLLGRIPPDNITNTLTVGMAVAGSLVAFLLPWMRARFSPISELAQSTKTESLILFADAVGLGAFTVMGAMTAVHAGYTGIEVTIVGVLTAVGGGVLRDLLANRPPEIFQGHLYAIPAVLGAAAVQLMGWLDQDRPSVSYAIAVIVAVVRMMGIRKNPRPLLAQDLVPAGREDPLHAGEDVDEAS